jgi:hypothetical protein
VVGVCIKWYQSRNNLCEKRKFRIMPPRRRRERPVVNATMEEEMRQLRARLDAMETMQRRAPKLVMSVKMKVKMLKQKKL